MSTIPPILATRRRCSRSVCKATGEAIPKGALRTGKLEAISGTYGAWTCLSAWRVPAVVYDNFAGSDVVETLVPVLLGLDGILLDGLRSLTAEDVQKVAIHCSNPAHWAKKTAKAIKATAKANADMAPEPDNPVAIVSTAAATTTTALAAPAPPTRPPPPTEAKEQALAGCVFVLSGVFVGSGTGLTAGKSDVAAEIERFGGRVVGSISGLTTHLLVGSSPGASKVQKARVKNLTVIDEAGLRALLKGEDAPEPVIDGLSAGFRGRGLAVTMSAEEQAALMNNGNKRLTDASEEEPEVKKARVE